MTSRWVLVSGDFTPLGGMDHANHGLASYLAKRPDTEVHLVTHRAWPDLEALPNLTVHAVVRPLGKHMLGWPLLDLAGRRLARRLGPSTHVVVNGGNCRWHDINWVHYVHAAWNPRPLGGLARRTKAIAAARLDRSCERANVLNARVVIANSERTRTDLIEHVGVQPDRVHTVYYGVDPDQFRPATTAERMEMRARLGWDDRPTVAFVGGLGDLRKGFDTLFEAWRLVAREWDARLAVIGAGSTLAYWSDQAKTHGLDGSIAFLGFRKDVPELLRACDALVSPTRYEAYGLNVHEALCSGLPAFVSRSAGVAERYPEGLCHYLIPDPDDAADLAMRLLRRRDRGRAGDEAALRILSEQLRGLTWDDMGQRIADVVERQG